MSCLLGKIWILKEGSELIFGSGGRWSEGIRGYRERKEGERAR